MENSSQHRDSENKSKF